MPFCFWWSAGSRRSTTTFERSALLVKSGKVRYFFIQCVPLRVKRLTKIVTRIRVIVCVPLE